MTDRRDRWIDKTIGARFRVVRKIAEGGMGAVYEAHDEQGGRRVAIKLLHAHLSSDEQITERFRREAFAASAIGDRRIVEVIHFGPLDDEGGVFMAMELLTGRDLAKVIREDGPLPIGRAARIATQIAEALSSVHGKGIVHRDLKPENVILDADDAVKVLDFGISKLTSPIEGVGEPTATKTGTTLGTPHYMAPEQAQAKKDVDSRVDVYALGVILFRALTGQHPFDDDSIPLLVLKIITYPPPPVRTWRGDVPRELEETIERMLAKDRDARFGSMRDVAQALAPFTSHDAPPDVIAAPSTSTHKARALDAPSIVSPHAPTAAWVEHAPRADDEPVPPPPGARPLPSWIFALFGVPILLLAGWGIWTMVDDDPIDPEPPLPELPEPRPPRAAPLVASRSPEGWSWINPIPRAMPTWHAIDVASGGDPVVLVGRDGMAARYAEGALFGWATGVDHDLRGVAWTGAREAIAVGEGGTAVRLTAEGPITIATGTDVTLRDVVVVSPTEAIAVGDAGVVLRISGDQARALDVGRRDDLLGAYARGTEVFVVGANGTAFRLNDGSMTREETGVDATLRSIGGCPTGGIYAAGDEGTLVYRHRGAWRAIATTTREALTGVSCDHGRVAIVASDGHIYLASGRETIDLPSGFTRPWNAIAGGPRGPSWIAGVGGRLATIEEDHVRTRTAGPVIPLRAMGSMGGALVAVGEWGRILRERERGIVEVDSPTDSGLAALIQIDEGRLIAIGDYGVMVDIRFDRASILESPTRSSLRSGVAEGDDLLMVGADGVIVRGQPGVFTVSRLEGAGDLWSVSGTPSRAIAVGDAGLALRIEGERVVRIDDCSDVTLRSVITTSAGAWAAGDDGRIVRIGEGCAEEHRGGPALHAIGVGPTGALIAGGDDGVVLVRGEDGTWAREGVDVAGASVRCVWRNAREVVLCGTEGVLVRHPRVDGE
jgi:serine/threonine protein kinase